MPYGPIALFGSGETSRRGRQIHEHLFRGLPKPVRVAILETPAGFQPNVASVSEKLRSFFATSLSNFAPEIQIVPARRRGGVFDTDSPEIVAPLERSSYIFAGPGSPSYAIRHLRGTRTLDRMLQRHASGAALSFSSAAAIAMGHYALPVYEIYKVGDDLGWLLGLDIFRSLGLDLTILPHWNNNDGGLDLDTSHCFMGAERFRHLRRMLSSDTTMLMIDEHTACVLYPSESCGLVMGAGQLRIVHRARDVKLNDGDVFSFDLLCA